MSDIIIKHEYDQVVFNDYTAITTNVTIGNISLALLSEDLVNAVPFTLSIIGTDGISVPYGTSLERPVDTHGLPLFRMNTELSGFEMYSPSGNIGWNKILLDGDFGSSDPLLAANNINISNTQILTGANFNLNTSVDGNTSDIVDISDIVDTIESVSNNNASNISELSVGVDTLSADITPLLTDTSRIETQIQNNTANVGDIESSYLMDINTDSGAAGFYTAGGLAPYFHGQSGSIDIATHRASTTQSVHGDNSFMVGAANFGGYDGNITFGTNNGSNGGKSIELGTSLFISNGHDTSNIILIGYFMEHYVANEYSVLIGSTIQLDAETALYCNIVIGSDIDVSTLSPSIVIGNNGEIRGDYGCIVVGGSDIDMSVNFEDDRPDPFGNITLNTTVTAGEISGNENTIINGTMPLDGIRNVILGSGNSMSVYNPTNNTVIGHNIVANEINNNVRNITSIGNRQDVSMLGTNIGYDITSQSMESVIIGFDTAVGSTSPSFISIGSGGSSSNAKDSSAIGYNTHVSYSDNTHVVGRVSRSLYSDYSVAVGYNNLTYSAKKSSSLGSNNFIQLGYQNTAVGYNIKLTSVKNFSAFGSNLNFYYVTRFINADGVTILGQYNDYIAIYESGLVVFPPTVSTRPDSEDLSGTTFTFYMDEFGDLNVANKDEYSGASVKSAPMHSVWELI